MPDIYHSFIIHGPINKVFEGISSSQGLDNWWTKSSKGKPEAGSTYELIFGAKYIWGAAVTKCKINKELELQMTEADPDWLGTKIGFSLNSKGDLTEVDFYHIGWPENSAHYRISSYCWAMYLRILKRNIEFGEKVPFEERLNV
jgi:uncharacterized protein YndB with AHSA1/START domain